MKTSSRQLHLLFTCHVPMTVTTCVTADLSASATPCSLGAVCHWMDMKREVRRIQQAVIHTFLPNSLLKTGKAASGEIIVQPSYRFIQYIRVF